MALSGKDGAVIVDGTELGEITEWNIDEDVDLEETPVFGDEVITHTETLKSASGSLSGYWDADDLDELAPGTTINNLELDINENYGVSAEAIVASRSVTNVVDGTAEMDIDFEFQEEPTWDTTE